jgi:hypothetical protein
LMYGSLTTSGKASMANPAFAVTAGSPSPSHYKPQAKHKNEACSTALTLGHHGSEQCCNE